MIQQFSNVIEQVKYEWPSKHILVVGDVMLDKYIWGEVSRISPEAPVPVIRATRESEHPGGAANVAMNLAHLGAQVTVIGFSGDDDNQCRLEHCLNENNITPMLIGCDGYPTITKLRIIGGHQQLVRLDSERLDTYPESDYIRLLQAALNVLPQADAVILSDYAKGVLTQTVCEQIIKGARSYGIPVLVDPKSADFNRYRGATTICPNLGELSAATHIDLRDFDALLDAAECLPESCELEFLTATLSEKGIALLRPGMRMIAPAQARQVFDVSGAGDTVISVLALSLASSLEPELAVQVANLAAGIVVAKVGTVPVEKHELLTALSSNPTLHDDNKVLTRNELATRSAQWKRNEEKVVFTNGCFDLIHVGHLTVLERARQQGDKLVVAINSDASVRRLKGPTRPIVSQENRARVLSALGVVDAVVIFDEATPLEMILAARPDVLVKGGDYSIETIVGAQEVQAWGGKVYIVPTVDGHSTTRLIAKGAAGQ